MHAVEPSACTASWWDVPYRHPATAKHLDPGGGRRQTSPYQFGAIAQL